MNHPSTSSDAYIQAIAVNLTALRDRLHEAFMRAEAASEASGADAIGRAIGALFGMDALLVEARALHQAALTLHRTHYAGRVGRVARQAKAADAPRASDVANVHLEVDELAKLGVLTSERASLLKRRLTADIVEEHQNTGMRISELIDLYNDLAALEPASSDTGPTEAELCAEFERYCTEQHLDERSDAIALLHRTDLTSDQRRWLSDFVRRWNAMRKRCSAQSG